MPVDDNEIVDKYFKLQQDIYSLFGYVEQWTVFPLEDRRQYFWFVSEHRVWYSSKKSNLDAVVAHYLESNELEWDITNVDSGDIYIDEKCSPLHTANDLAMVQVDTNTDGNVFLAIYDIGKQVRLPGGEGNECS